MFCLVHVTCGAHAVSCKKLFLTTRPVTSYRLLTWIFGIGLGYRAVPGNVATGNFMIWIKS